MNTGPRNADPLAEEFSDLVNRSGEKYRALGRLEMRQVVLTWLEKNLDAMSLESIRSLSKAMEDA